MATRLRWGKMVADTPGSERNTDHPSSSWP
jgi:hypothetical protein